MLWWIVIRHYRNYTIINCQWITHQKVSSRVASWLWDGFVLWSHINIVFELPQRFYNCRLSSSSLQSMGYWRVLSGRRCVSWCQAAAVSGRMTSSTGAHTGRGPGSGVYVNVRPVAYMMPSFLTSDTGTWNGREDYWIDYYNETIIDTGKKLDYSLKSLSVRSCPKASLDWWYRYAYIPE